MSKLRPRAGEATQQPRRATLRPATLQQTRGRPHLVPALRSRGLSAILGGHATTLPVPRARHRAGGQPAPAPRRGQQCPCPATAPRLGGKHHTLRWLFPRQSRICVRQSCVLGATRLSEIFIRSPFFPLTKLTPHFLDDGSITAAFVLGHTNATAPCSCRVCHATGPSRTATSGTSFFCVRTNPSFSRFLLPSRPRMEDLVLTSQHIHLGACWARRKPSSPKARQTSDTTELKIHIFQTKVQSPNGKRIQEKCGRPGWWLASSMSTSLRRNPARSLD